MGYESKRQETNQAKSGLQFWGSYEKERKLSKHLVITLIIVILHDAIHELDMVARLQRSLHGTKEDQPCDCGQYTAPLNVKCQCTLCCDDVQYSQTSISVKTLYVLWRFPLL